MAKVRSPTRLGRFGAVRRLHVVLGWVIALWLLMMVGTGSLLLAKAQLKQAFAPPCPSGLSLPLPVALATIDRMFAGRVATVLPASAELCFHEVLFRGAAGGAYVDPATLEVAQSWGRNERLTDFLLELHRHLLLAEAGKAPVAALAIVTMLLTSLGLALALRNPQALSLRLRPLAYTPGALLMSHRNIGAIVAVPLSFMALSGWALTYPATAQSLLRWGFDDPVSEPPPLDAPEPGSIRWGAVMAAGARAFPGLEPRVVAWPSRPGEPIALRYRQPGEWAAKGFSIARVSPVRGRLLSRADALNGARSQRIFWALHPLHAGLLVWPVGALVVAAVGMGIAFSICLAITASVLRLGRDARRRSDAMPAGGGARPNRRLCRGAPFR